MLEVYIYTILDLHKKKEFYKNSFHQTELDELKKIKNQKVSMNYLCCRGALKELLSLKTKKKACDLEFSYNTHGKPHLKDFESHHFNMSHSHEFCVIAYSSLAPVGVDVEYKERKRSLDLMAQKILSSKEKKEFQELFSEKEKNSYFFKKWTLKESVTKAIGKGMALSFSHIDPVFVEQKEEFFVDYEGLWKGKFIDFHENYCLCVVSKSVSSIKIHP